MDGISCLSEYSTRPESDSPVFFTIYPSLNIFWAKRCCAGKEVIRIKTSNLSVFMADYQTYPTKVQKKSKKIKKAL
jgi:hypothetical protein